jgi:hypothetical protein
MARQEGGRAAGAMGVQPVPDDQEGPADLAPEVRRRARITTRLETLPRTCRAYNRPAGVTATTLETSRRLLSRRSTGVTPRPGRARAGPEAVPGFIEEDDGAPLAAGPLF